MSRARLDEFVAWLGARQGELLAGLSVVSADEYEHRMLHLGDIDAAIRLVMDFADERECRGG